MSYPGIQFPRKAQILFRPAPWKVLYSGRAACKSWSVAQALILLAHSTYPHKIHIEGGGVGFKPLRILCAREIQASIKDSVHVLLKDQITRMGLLNDFKVTDTSIISRKTGAEFIFKGLRINMSEIKSMEGVNIVWVEEAQFVSAESWEILGPTVFRNEIDSPSIDRNGEIWVTFNPDDEKDATFQKFVANEPPPGAVVERMYWYENPWFTPRLEKERAFLERTDPEAYANVWMGECKTIGDAVIFKGKYEPRIFDWKEVLAEKEIEVGQQRWFHGNDFGFADSPNALVRSFITGKYPDEELWIEKEVYGYGTEIDNLPALFDKMDTARTWPIKADSARPEIISHLARQGFNIQAAEKWQGSVEDGIAHLKMFKKIYVHTVNCPRLIDEFRLYSYKVDKKKLDLTGKAEVLPIIVDKHNHGIDSIRYSLDGFIQRRGVDAIWAKLGQ